MGGGVGGGVSIFSLQIMPLFLEVMWLVVGPKSMDGDFHLSVLCVCVHYVCM